ncbi:MAG: glycosyltransferase, partial [Halobacteria archaeon]|nr:glycosyltransferase [Halobacteria archaeon]
MDSDDVCVLIPTLNESATIGEVIDGFKEQGYENVFVIDGGSEDDTQEVAREKGAQVVEQSGSGKGQAVQEALRLIDSPYIVMIDGDGTYLPSEVNKLLEPLERGYDHVIGDRLGNREAFTRLNYVGNRIFNTLFRFA